MFFSEMELQCLGPAIKSIARMLSSEKFDISCLEDLGKRRAWELLESGNDSPSDILSGVENTIKSFVSEEYQQSEKQDEKEELQDSPFLRKSVLVNEDTKEKSALIKKILKEHFGRTYLKKIKEKHESFPGKIVKYLIEGVWNLRVDEIPGAVDYKLFVDSGIGNFLWAFYKNSPMRAVQDAYPSKFFEWEFSRVPDAFWDGRQGYENALIAVKWIVDKYKVIGKEKKVPVGYDEFQKQGLGRMLKLHFSHSPFLALRTVFPDLKQWQMQSVPNEFYNDKNNHKIALESLLQDLNMPVFSQLTSEEIYDCNTRKIRKKDFEERRLSGLLNRHNRCVYEVFDSVYSNKVYPWFFLGCHRVLGSPQEYAAKAIRWLFDDYLKIPKEKVPFYASNKLFWRLGFSGILTRRDVRLNSSTYRAVNLAYPGEFSKSDFKRRNVKGIYLSKDFRR